MKTTRTYYDGCKFCQGKGQIPSTYPIGSMSTSPYETCPVCSGSKVIPITETIES